MGTRPRPRPWQSPPVRLKQAKRPSKVLGGPGGSPYPGTMRRSRLHAASVEQVRQRFIPGFAVATGPGASGRREVASAIGLLRLKIQHRMQALIDQQTCLQTVGGPHDLDFGIAITVDDIDDVVDVNGIEDRPVLLRAVIGVKIRGVTIVFEDTTKRRRRAVAGNPGLDPGTKARSHAVPFGAVGVVSRLGHIPIRDHAISNLAKTAFLSNA